MKLKEKNNIWQIVFSVILFILKIIASSYWTLIALHEYNVP